MIDRLSIAVHVFVSRMSISFSVDETLLPKCCMLTFDPAKHAIPKWCTRKKWHILMASNRKKSRRRIWLTKWDKVKAHDTFIDWYTGREWPLNCMTVISAWWRSNMPFQRLSGQLSGRLNYYITRWEQEVSELEIRRVGDQTSWRWCGKESHHPAEGALGTPDGVWGQDQLVIRCSRESQQSGPSGLRLSIRITRTTHGYVRRGWWGQYVAVFVRSPTPSHS